jgi:hypothetical protein
LNRAGSSVYVQATDNVMVYKVTLTVLDAEGRVLEQAQGVPRSDDLWECVLNAEGKMLVEAWDLAGNRTQAQL